MSFDINNLLASFIFGVVGIAGWKYGRRIGSIRKLFISVGLCLYPYFVTNAYLIWGVGAGLTAALIFWEEA